MFNILINNTLIASQLLFFSILFNCNPNCEFIFRFQEDHYNGRFARESEIITAEDAADFTERRAQQSSVEI